MLLAGMYIYSTCPLAPKYTPQATEGSGDDLLETNHQHQVGIFEYVYKITRRWTSYRNDRTSDHYVSEATASRVVYGAGAVGSRVSVQPHLSMTWQADECSVAVISNPVSSQVNLL